MNKSNAQHHGHARRRVVGMTRWDRKEITFWAWGSWKHGEKDKQKEKMLYMKVTVQHHCVATANTKARRKTKEIKSISGYFPGMWPRTEQSAHCPLWHWRTLGELCSMRVLCMSTTKAVWWPPERSWAPRASVQDSQGHSAMPNCFSTQATGPTGWEFSPGQGLWGGNVTASRSRKQGRTGALKWVEARHARKL